VATVSLSCAALAIAVSFAPAPLHLAALALAIAALATGIDGFRRRTKRGAERLRAGAGAFVGGSVLVLAIAKVVITAVAIRHLAASL
jgi:hypothetical protein